MQNVSGSSLCAVTFPPCAHQGRKNLERLAEVKARREEAAAKRAAEAAAKAGPEPEPEPEQAAAPAKTKKKKKKSKSKASEEERPVIALPPPKEMKSSLLKLQVRVWFGAAAQARLTAFLSSPARPRNSSRITASKS